VHLASVAKKTELTVGLEQNPWISAYPAFWAPLNSRPWRQVLVLQCLGRRRKVATPKSNWNLTIKILSRFGAA